MTKLFKYIAKKFESILEDYMNTELDVTHNTWEGEDEDNRLECASHAVYILGKKVGIVADYFEDALVNSSIVDKVAEDTIWYREN